MVVRKSVGGKRTTPVTKKPESKVTAVAITEEEVTTPDTGNVDYYYGFKVIKRTTLKLAEIVRVYNVRSLSNETAIDNDLLESIKAVGVKNPLVLNDKNELLDGHRRFYHAKQVFEPNHDVDVIIIDIKATEVAYFQYLTGLEKGHTKDERDTAILKYAQDNPETSDREIARRFGMGNATVSGLTKIIREAPTLAPYILNRQISKNVAAELVIEAKKHKREPDKIAKAFVTQLTIDNKLSTDTATQKPITRAVSNKILTNLIPKFQPEGKKSQSAPTAKKLLKDLFCHLKPVGDIGKSGRQQYSAEISPDLIKQIELLINGSIADKYKYKFHKEFKLERKTEYIEKVDLIGLWMFYCGLTLESSVTPCLSHGDTWYFADENSEFMEDILSSSHFDVDSHREFYDGADWCQVKKSALSEEKLIEIAKDSDLHLLIIELVHVASDDDDDVTEQEAKKELEIIEKQPTEAKETKVEIDTEQDDDDDDDDDDIDYSQLLDEFTEVELDEETILSDELDDEDDEEVTEDDI